MLKAEDKNIRLLMQQAMKFKMISSITCMFKFLQNTIRKYTERTLNVIFLIHYLHM